LVEHGGIERAERLRLAGRDLREHLLVVEVSGLVVMHQCAPSSAGGPCSGPAGPDNHDPEIQTITWNGHAPARVTNRDDTRALLRIPSAEAAPGDPAQSSPS